MSEEINDSVHADCPKHKGQPEIACVECRVEEKNVLTIKELIERPVLREEACFKWMTKISAEELRTWEDEVWKDILEDPDIPRYEKGSSMMARVIDREILYELLEQGEQHHQNELDKDCFE